jgi:hypothetical protein
MTIIRSDRETARYNFEGELTSVYWSPTEKYVAINNHSGHAGWFLWIISLEDGRVIRANGETAGADYVRYVDIDYEPSLDAAQRQLLEVYPSVNQDSSRTGWHSIAYGWKDEERLSVFIFCTFDRLAEEQHSAIQIYATYRVRGRSGISAEDFSVRKVRGGWWEQAPSELKKTLRGHE